MRGLAERFHAARTDPALALLEGFHPLKHALRFGAEVVETVCRDRAGVADLVARLAPDLKPAFDAMALREVDESTFAATVRRAPPAPIVAIARRPPPAPFASLEAPLVLLDRPTHHGNVGAVVRVAAAAGAAGVVCLDGVDPWHPAALRGGAGLQFAVPARRVTSDPEPPRFDGRETVAVVPGEPAAEEPLPAGAVLLFGSERDGLRNALVDGADRRVGIPMRPGVSSLNLATAVAVMLYGHYPPPVG